MQKKSWTPLSAAAFRSKITDYYVQALIVRFQGIWDICGNTLADETNKMAAWEL